MPRAFVGLGANLGDPSAQIEAALARLAQHPAITVTARSALYRSAALGPGPQPDYCNAVCAIDTGLAPDAVLAVLQQVEAGLGRTRPVQRWAPRIIDLDLLHYEGVRQPGPGLALPHPELARRSFVLVPLAQVAPDLELPGMGRVEELVAALGHPVLPLWPRAQASGYSPGPP